MKPQARLFWRAMPGLPYLAEKWNILVTGVTTASPFNRPFPRFAATPRSSIGTNLFRALTSFTTGSFGFLLADKCRKLTTCRVESKWLEPSERVPGFGKILMTVLAVIMMKKLRNWKKMTWIMREIRRKKHMLNLLLG
ncbi:conserved hypothetical protein [Ricinus communis]|uniref:Uncharacterized protein n=1 Tax=Ricinus communis TaxID=3988 RepID=B9S1R7_RICCO|nr:conserved hypothetical protein [Ricinus communis]